MITLPRAALLVAAISATAHAHLAPWTKGMYCKNGLSATDQQAVDYPITPLWNMSQNDWFLHGPCRQYPPPDGEYLKIPANGNFTVEIAANRVFTTLSYNGLKATDWPDGQNHTDPYYAGSEPNFPATSAGCISSPNNHAKAEADAAGTAFAISYNGDMSTVQPSDFTVFSVLQNSPWKRLATYQAPNLPACPSGGCLCAWAWIPNHCGQDNMYQLAFRCQVTGADSNAPAVGKSKPAAWCESEQDRCVSGPKQLTIAFQAEGNNFVSPGGLQKDNSFPSPGYNLKMGFKAGAQNDIFLAPGGGASTSTAYAPGSTCASKVFVTTTAIATATSYQGCPTAFVPATVTKTVTITAAAGSSATSVARMSRRRRGSLEEHHVHEQDREHDEDYEHDEIHKHGPHHGRRLAFSRQH